MIIFFRGNRAGKAYLVAKKRERGDASVQKRAANLMRAGECRERVTAA